MNEIDPPVITDPADISAEWMSAVLQSAGHDVRVRSVRSAPVGTGQMAHNERLYLEYEGDAGSAPRTLVGKFPSPNEESRASGARGGYRTEVNFYTRLAERLSIRTPACYYGSVAEDSTTFTLLLEDLAPAAQGDQIQGASDAQIEAAVVNLAGLHAPLWGAAELDEVDWLGSFLGEEMLSLVKMVTPLFLERYDGRLSPDTLRTLQRFAEGFGDWAGRQPEARTLVHGDYRLDNLMFATPAGGAQVAAVDWQTLSIGAGGRDLAYLLGNGSPKEQRRVHEGRMLEAYRKGLDALGVVLSADEVRHSYAHGSFQGPLITILGAFAVGQTDRGDEMFLAMAERGAAQIEDLGAFELIG